MRQIALIAVLLLLLPGILLAGCSQPAAPAATPAPTPSPSLSPAPSLTMETTASASPTPTGTVVARQKQIEVTAVQDGSDVVVRYRGGSSGKDLTALVIKIDSYDGRSITEREENPVVGQEFAFPARGMAGSDTITVTGIFRDGSNQVLLKKNV